MEIPNYPNYLFYPDGRLWSKSRMRYLKPHAVSGGLGYMLRHNKQGENFSIIELLETYYPQNPLPSKESLKSILNNPNGEETE
jgi:hypothetical protein